VRELVASLAAGLEVVGHVAAAGDEGHDVVDLQVAGGAAAHAFAAVAEQDLGAEAAPGAGGPDADRVEGAPRAARGPAAHEARLQSHPISGERFWEAETLRLRGRLLMAAERAPQSEIEACLRSAAAIAHEQASRSLELRAASTLGPWLAVRGQADEAVAMLKAPLRAFTEGFDTGDLQEAERLLGVLSVYSGSSSTTR
jgi:hypothetical protein